uniref:Locustamyotropin-2 n=1 Tax=Locusta migratoria TaxID=7004 RepID=LMT2_LOCMI|nr:RecName: Full=Locustamyotropin-2; AltName: Full=Lom-MT-2 [Locusta migratoria]prf//1713291A locustamyotropin II [Locusta migratoria]
EGDFTPRL